MKHVKFLGLFLSVIFLACSGDDDSSSNGGSNTGPNLIIKFEFSETQARLNNLGQPSTIPAGNAAQTPSFNSMSANYIEFAPTMFTQLGGGEVVYEGPTTTQGGDEAIHFDNATFVGHGQTFLSIPISQVSPGSYEWARSSLSYQNYNIDVLESGNVLNGTLASFVGFNTYISNFLVNTETVAVNGNKLQGYWAFEVVGQTFEGQAPPGATTVPNPIFSTSPIPQGSCVVTGQFATPLVITGNETEDITVTLSLSINNSFEWQEVNADGMYEPSAGEQVVDMGFRGLVPSVN